MPAAWAARSAGLMPSVSTASTMIASTCEATRLSTALAWVTESSLPEMICSETPCWSAIAWAAALIWLKNSAWRLIVTSPTRSGWSGVQPTGWDFGAGREAAGALGDGPGAAVEPAGGALSQAARVNRQAAAARASTRFIEPPTGWVDGESGRAVPRDGGDRWSRDGVDGGRGR